jgi:thymidylate kinase
MLISFSGLDGAGKTTQIHLLRTFLAERGFDVEPLEMNKNVSASNFMRTKIKPLFSKKARQQQRNAPGGGRGRGKPPAGGPGPNGPAAQTRGSNDPPAVEDDLSWLPPGQYRYDKNRKETSRVVLRQATYIVDLMTLCLVRFYWEGLRRKLVVMDRYIYDSLANLYDTNPIAVAFMNLFVKISPAPTIAFFMDAEPDVAFARKPEYPRDYYTERAAAYRDLFTRIPSGRIVKVRSIDETQEELREIVSKQLNRRRADGDE